jgi:molybdopterin-guanine dinucleotide biosynthesis protein A
LIVTILAGGPSTRFHINKLVYPIKGKPLINHTVEKVKKCKSVLKVFLIATPLTVNRYQGIEAEVILDPLGVGPIGGIYTTLKMFKEAMILAGDMPLINCGYIETMINLCKGYRYACLPIWRKTGFLEPLAGIYSKDILPIIEHGLAVGELSIQRLIKKFNLDIKTIPIEVDLNIFIDMFKNINKLEDIYEIIELL